MRTNLLKKRTINKYMYTEFIEKSVMKRVRMCEYVGDMQKRKRNKRRKERDEGEKENQWKKDKR